MVIRKVVLRLITDAVADRQILTRLPIVFSIQSKIHHRRTDRMNDLVMLNWLAWLAWYDVDPVARS